MKIGDLCKIIEPHREDQLIDINRLFLLLPPSLSDFKEH
jgi:hypothetical protein